MVKAYSWTKPAWSFLPRSLVLPMQRRPIDEAVYDLDISTV